VCSRIVNLERSGFDALDPPVEKLTYALCVAPGLPMIDVRDQLGEGVSAWRPVPAKLRDTLMHLP
jgi:hypothetical protein